MWHEALLDKNLHFLSPFADGLDFFGGSTNLTFAPNQTRVCYVSEADGFIIDDDVFESEEIFQLSISPFGFDSRFLEVVPELSTAFVYIVDDEGRDIKTTGLKTTGLPSILSFALYLATLSKYSQ